MNKYSSLATCTDSTIIADATHNKKVYRVFKKIGYMNGIKLADTLQGSIWRAWKIPNEGQITQKPDIYTTVAIKVTNQFLHKHAISMVDNKIHNVNEDILMEQQILKYLTQHKDCPHSIVKFVRFIKSNTDYYLVMEDGKESLLKFVKKAHKLIQSGQIDMNDWMKVVKIIFNQMIECIDYIHSKNVCHFDISLENFLINDVRIEVPTNYDNAQHKKTNIRFLTDGIQIKLCDFGLAQLFTECEFLSDKYCGKKQYKSPECIGKKKRFDAKKNDIWGLGVCLFMMITGHSPWNVANITDDRFVYIMNGYIVKILKELNCFDYIDKNVIDLIESIFQYEVNRICLNDIKQNIWLQMNIHNDV